MSVSYGQGVCLLAGLLVISGCSSGGGGTDKSSAASAAWSPVVTQEAVAAPKSSADVRALLGQAGLVCTPVPTTKRAVGSENAVDFEECEVDGEKININVWKDEGQVENWEGFTKQVGCRMGKQFGVVNLDWVRGDLWTIDDVTQTLADKIGAATGATPVHIKCE